MKNGKKKGFVAPVIITVILLAYFAVYFGLLVTQVPGVAKILLAIVPLAMAGVAIYVCMERIKEIRSGEEDDLGQY